MKGGQYKLTPLNICTVRVLRFVDYLRHKVKGEPYEISSTYFYTVRASYLQADTDSQTEVRQYKLAWLSL